MSSGVAFAGDVADLALSGLINAINSGCIVDANSCISGGLEYGKLEELLLQFLHQGDMLEEQTFAVRFSAGVTRATGRLLASVTGP